MEPPGDRGERRAKEFSRTNSKNRNSGRNLGRCSCNMEGAGASSHRTGADEGPLGAAKVAALMSLATVG